MSESTTVSSVLLDMLTVHEIDTAFGIPGVHNLGLWNAVSPERPRIIGVRHEQAAGYAADGLYRATGKIAAALLTSGPGAANIMAAFGEAFTAYSRMLVISSDVGTGLRRPGVTRGILHEMLDQAAMFRAFGAFAVNSTSAHDAIVNAATALHEVLEAPGRPAYVGVPSNVLEEPWTGDLPEQMWITPHDLDVQAIEELAVLIAASKRPVLWLGGGVVSSGAEESVRLLAHRIGAVVVTSFAGRGLLAGDSHTIELPVHEPEVGAIIAEGDLLIVLGSDFDAMNTKNWKMPLPDVRAVMSLGTQVEQTIDWDLVVPAELRDGLATLSQMLDERGIADRPLWQPDAGSLRERVMARLRGDDRVKSAIAFVDALEAGWSQDAAIVGDMAVAGFWSALYSYQSRPRRAQYPVGWGTLGYALPAAMGPASQGMPTLAVCGDGGPMFAIGELATYAQESMPITLLVVDDGGYGMLRFDQQVFGHPERGVDLLTPDWVALAGSFGITGVQIGDIGQLADELAIAGEANRRGEPRLIVWKQRLYPPATTSPRWFE